MNVSITIPNEEKDYTFVIINNKTGRIAESEAGMRCIESCDFVLALACNEKMISAMGMGVHNAQTTGNMIDAMANTMQEITQRMPVLQRLKAYADWKLAAKLLRPDQDDVIEELVKAMDERETEEDDDEAAD